MNNQCNKMGFIKRNSEVIRTIALCVTMCATMVGGCSAYCAYKNYIAHNNIQITATLYNMDKLITDSLINKPFLQALFAIPSKDMDVCERSMRLVNILLENSDEKINDIDNIKSINFEWKSIPDLFDKIWGLEDFNNPHKVVLRIAFTLSEQIIYVIYNAKYAVDQDIYDNDEYETWVAYLNEIARHPVFLAALYGCHKTGYIDKKFAHEMKERLLKNPETKKVIEVFWEDINKDDWVERVGKTN